MNQIRLSGNDPSPSTAKRPRRRDESGRTKNARSARRGRPGRGGRPRKPKSRKSPVTMEMPGMATRAWTTRKRSRKSLKVKKTKCHW